MLMEVRSKQALPVSFPRDGSRSLPLQIEELKDDLEALPSEVFLGNGEVGLPTCHPLFSGQLLRGADTHMDCEHGGRRAVLWYILH